MTEELKIKVGDTFQHLGNMRLYKIKGFSKFSDDGGHDGKEIITYAEVSKEEVHYSSPLERFKRKFKFWSVAGCKC